MKKQTRKQSKTTKCTVECKWLQKLKKGKASIKSTPPVDLQRQKKNCVWRGQLTCSLEDIHVRSLRFDCMILSTFGLPKDRSKGYGVEENLNLISSVLLL